MTKIYGIVGTQRSGSNYVCSALRGIKGLGDPREYFSPVHIHDEGEPEVSIGILSHHASMLAEDLRRYRKFISQIAGKMRGCESGPFETKRASVHEEREGS